MKAERESNRSNACIFSPFIASVTIKLAAFVGRLSEPRPLESVSEIGNCVGLSQYRSAVAVVAAICAR